MVATANQLARAVRQQIPIEHPQEDEMGYLYGIIFTDGSSGAGAIPSRNVCVFADGQVDRSPTGSGVTARLALNAAKGLAATGELYHFESLTDAIFTGKIASKPKIGTYRAVTVEVSGRAHYCGTAEFTYEDDDLLAGGFLLK
jgi:trans-L-3-hydroxyproline dehydratase